ncbi:OmpL47-type beta-barrel domain-containing protein [Neobacillus niacini]|uniref:OmpL47-type beta-barrel domain-containing protein n=1 Tax=Neobacillus niacini TaxID=86668 RepID=UPI001C8D6334|nr:MBL fold metallo-hydrolase [Neobacillus niacini]MBY0148849.1 MBL fold metallo-hydrolase [Neobacillus niacini]
MSTKGEFITYPVGQGLFYAGKLIKDNDEFNFIYDCGSNSQEMHLKKCITEYRTFNDTKDIDMLVISHFDRDHINGLDEIAGHYNIKRIFFPYFKNMNINLFSYELEILRLKGVIQSETKVISTSIPEGQDPKKKNPEFPELEELEEDASKTPTKLKLQVPKPNKDPGKNTHIDVKEEDLYKSFKILELKNNQFKVFDWLFDFYNYPLSTTEIRNINKSFRDFISTHKIKDFKDFISREEIRKPFVENVFSKKNIQAYTYISNNISLCMMHAPERVLTCKERIATLLTGDLSLKDNKIFKNFNEQYSYIMSKLKVFFIPHHGSRNNWNDQLMYLYCKKALSIATVGSGKGHPDFEVISKIFLSKNDVVCITEKFDSYKYIIDQKAPVTALSTKPGSPNGKNGWYKSDVQVSLSATDSGFGGVKTEYRKNGGPWTPYNGAFKLNKDETYIIDYRGTDNVSNTEGFNTKIINLDKTAPALNIGLDKSSLWPADQRMVTVTVQINATDATSDIDSVMLTSISSNEDHNPDDIQANLNTPITDFTDSFELRADRISNENDRVYTITYTATDKAGNVTTKSVTVSVPHEKSKK